MSKGACARGLIVILVALAMSLAFARSTHASPALVSLDSATIPPGKAFKVALRVAPQPGENVSALTVDITFDGRTVKPIACEPSQVCNVSYKPGVVRIVLATLAPLSGQVGSVTLQASAEAKGSTSLGLTIVTCADDRGVDLGCRSQPGSIAVDPGAAEPSMDAGGTVTLPTGFPEGAARALAREPLADSNSLSSNPEDDTGGGSNWWVWLVVGTAVAGGVIALLGRKFRRQRDKPQ